MSNPTRPQAARASNAPPDETDFGSTKQKTTQTVELREEQLVAHKDQRHLGQIEVRTVVDEVPARMEVEAYREEVVVEHEAVGLVVSERDQPWEEDDVLIVPIYEEQLVVTKRLVLRERMRIRRIGTTERQLLQDTLRRERLVVDDPQNTGLVHELYQTGGSEGTAADDDTVAPGRAEPENDNQSGFLGHLVRKALE